MTLERTVRLKVWALKPRGEGVATRKAARSAPSTFSPAANAVKRVADEYSATSALFGGPPLVVLQIDQDMSARLAFALP